MKADLPDRLLSAQEAMAILVVKRSWLTHHAAELQAVKVGKYLRFTGEGLAAYVQRQRVPAPARHEEPTPIRRERPGVAKHRHANNPVTGLRWQA